VSICSDAAASCRISLDRPGEALPYLQRAAAIADDLAQRDPNQFTSRERVFTADTQISKILRRTNPNLAVKTCNLGLKRLAEIKDNPVARMHEVEALAASTYPLRRLGRGAEDRRRLDAAFERVHQLNAYPAEFVKPGSEVDAALSALVDYEAENGNVPRAIEIYQELLRKGAAHPMPNLELVWMTPWSYRACMRPSAIFIDRLTKPNPNPPLKHCGWNCGGTGTPSSPKITSSAVNSRPPAYASNETLVGWTNPRAVGQRRPALGRVT
jgi:hypothetical protein